MFGSATLSTGQRASGAFVLVAVPDPGSSSRQQGALIDFKKLPKVCLVLYVVGSVGFCGGWALKYLLAA